jgi:MYXO-CTERM domain-containing protein
MAQGGDADHYWLYPMRTNLTPFSSHPSGTTPDNSRAGNIFGFDSLPNGYDDGFAVTGSPSFDAAQNYLTNVGAYTQSRSYFGAFDLGGNVMEWNETMDASFFRGVRGGSWSLLAADLRSSSRSFLDASGAGNVVGFRVDTVPEPTVAGIALLGALGLAARRPRRRR